MPEIKNVFTQGKMNKDLDERMVPNGQYRDAMNIQVTTSDSSDVGVVQNILGNEKIIQGSLEVEGATGSFQCVGAVADEKTDSIYYFVRGSSLDAIIELSNGANAPVVVDVNKDVLKFNGSYITGINVIDGLIYFTDNTNEPKKINIQTLKAATNGAYSHTQVHGRDIEEKDITVIKKKPNVAPYLVLTTSNKDGYIGEYDSSGAVYYGIARQRILQNKQVGSDINLFMEVDPSPAPIFQYKVGDKLLLSATSNNVPTSGNEEVLVTVVEVFERVADSSYTTTGFRQRIKVKVDKITNTVTAGTNDLNVVFVDSSSNVNNKKFFRFATRYKYEDNEYSAFGPWSEIAFLPSFYEYAPTKEPYNLGMQNAAKSIILKNFVGPDTPEDVYSIDILYKEENSNTVYIVDNVSRTDVNNLTDPITGDLDYNNFNYPWGVSGDFTGKYTITSQNIKSAVPEDQILRVWDNVPIKALAQEVVANRLVYGNYTENYDVSTKPTLKAFIENRNIFFSDSSNFDIRGQESIKTSREYQVGVVFSDEYGRETPVFTDESTSLSSEFYYDYPKRLTASLTSFTPPDWAIYYKFYIKETSGEYYNLAMDRAYPADEDRNLWISFPSSDRNKLQEDDYLILKKPRLKEDTTLDNWELGLGNGIQEENKFKVIDIKNEAPEFVKTKYFSLGKAKNGNAGNNTLQDHLFRGISVMPASGRDLLKIDKHFWYHSSGGWNNQDLIPDDKGIEENVLAIQFSIPGVLSGTTQFSKRYEITSVSTNHSHTTPAATANNIFYTLQLKQPIEQEDAWVQSSTNTLDTNLTVEIFKLEKNNTQEFEGRFFVKIMGNQMTREFIETREGGSFVSLASMDVFNLSDADYQTQTATASSAGSTTDEGSWGSLLYNFSGDSSNNGFFIDSMHFASGQSNANNSIGNSGILTAPDTNVIAEEIVAATPDTKKDELISGIHEGFITADNTHTHNSASSTDFSDAGEKGWRTQPQQLILPIDDAAPTAQPGTTRYVYANGKHYIHISFSACGENLFDGSEEFPLQLMGTGSYTDYYQFNAPLAGNSGSQVATSWVNKITRGSGQDLKYRPTDVLDNPPNGWAKIPNYDNSNTSAYKVSNGLYPTVDPNLNSPNHIYTTTSKRKWRNMWDPTINASANIVQERVDFISSLEQEGSQFYFNNDPNQEVYTILSQPKKIRLYNHTSWRTTWVEDVNAPTFDKAIIKRHLSSTLNNNSVEEALLGLLAHGNTGALQDYEGNTLTSATGYANIKEYLKDMMYSFGLRNNRRVVYVVEVDKDPSTVSWNPVAEITSTSASALTFIEQNLSSDDPGLPKSPAIWETEPKEELDLDIYYEVSNNIPFNIDDDTNELFAPVGSTLYAFTTSSDNDWTHQDLFSNGNAFISEWTGPNEFTTKGLGYLYYDIGLTYMQTMFSPDFSTPINPSDEGFWIDEDLDLTDVGAKNIYLKLYDPNTYNYVTAKVIDFQLTAGDFTVGIEPDIQKVRIQQIENHLLDVGLGWWNCVNFGNGVESDRVRDDFNEVQINNGVKASTIVSEKYEQEVKKNTLIYSNVYNPLSNVNGFNQFIFANKITKSLSPNYGSIQKLFTRDNDLISFCEDKVVQIAADKDILFNADGNPQLVASNKVLGQSRPFEGDFGISQDPESFASESYRSYFTDRKRRSVLRLSKDGITRISDHGMSDYFHDNMLSASVLLGSFDFNKQQYNLTGVDGKVISFSESVKGWVSFKSFTQMELGISVSGDYYTFYNATPYLHHSINSSYNTFYDIHEPSSLTAVLNESPSLIKKFKTINYEGTQGLVQAFTSDPDNEYYNLSGSSGWYVDFIETDNNVFNYGTNSFLEFKNKENKWFSSIRGNSIEENATFDISSFNFQGIGEKSN